MARHKRAMRIWTITGHQALKLMESLYYRYHDSFVLLTYIARPVYEVPKITEPVRQANGSETGRKVVYLIPVGTSGQYTLEAVLLLPDTF